MSFSNYVTKNYAIFKKSFNLRKYLISLGIDFLTLILLIAVFFSFYTPASNTLMELDDYMSSSADIGDFNDITATSGMVDYVEGMFIFLFFLTIGLILSLLVVTSVSRLFLWRLISNSKSPSERNSIKLIRILKYYLSSLSFLIVFVIIPFLLFSGNSERLSQLISSPARIRAFSVILLILLFAYLHTHLLFNFFFARSSKVFSSLKKSLNFGILGIGNFILPYGLFLLTILAIYYFMFILNYIIPLRFIFFLFIILVFLLISIFRLYYNRYTYIFQKKFNS